MAEPIQLDSFLNGLVELYQYQKKGLKGGSLSVFLAASVDLQPNKSNLIAEFGAGFGVVSLLINHHFKAYTTHYPQTTLQINAFEINPPIYELAVKNALHNNSLAVRFHLNAIQHLTERDYYQQVVFNPPFHKSVEIAKWDDKTLATHEQSNNSLADWIHKAYQVLQHKGLLTFIIRSDRLNDIVQLLANRWGNITVFPLFPTPHSTSNFMLIRAKKNAKGGFQLHRGLILTNEDSSPSVAAESVLRHGRRIEW